VDGDHGRIETRAVTVIHDVGWLQERHQWPGLNSLVMVESTRQTGDQIERETRFYITSLTLLAIRISAAATVYLALAGAAMLVRSGDWGRDLPQAPFRWFNVSLAIQLALNTATNMTSHNAAEGSPGRPGLE
jgi:hypothetical protein